MDPTGTDDLMISEGPADASNPSMSDEASPVEGLPAEDAPAGPSGPKEKPDPPGLGLENILVKDLVPSHMNLGVLIPLKTNLEVRQDHTLVQAYITRAPTKSANDVVKYVLLPSSPPCS